MMNEQRTMIDTQGGTCGDRWELELYCRMCLETLHVGDGCMIVSVNGQATIMHAMCAGYIVKRPDDDA